MGRVRGAHVYTTRHLECAIVSRQARESCNESEETLSSLVGVADTGYDDLESIESEAESRRSRENFCASPQARSEAAAAAVTLVRLLLMTLKDKHTRARRAIPSLYKRTE